MVVLKWAGDTFQNSHPEEKMPEEDSVGPFQTVITLVAIAAVSFGIYKTGRSHSSDNSPAAPSGAKAEIQTRHVSATLKKRLAPWLENWRKRRVPIDITASANDTETYDYSIEVKKYVESQGLKVTPIDYVVWGQGAEPHDEDAFLDPTFQTIRIGRLKKNRP